MRKLESIEKHNQFVADLMNACEGTAWEIRVRKYSDGDIDICVAHTDETLRQQYMKGGPNVYAPSIYFDDGGFARRDFGFKIQTTSYGALKTSEIEKFAASYHQAVALVHKLSAIINEYYPTDTATK